LPSPASRRSPKRLSRRNGTATRTRCATASRRGDVVLVPFPFSDLTAVKRRPALVVSTQAYNEATGDAIIAQITSKVKSTARPGDYILLLARCRPAPALPRPREAHHFTLVALHPDTRQYACRRDGAHRLRNVRRARAQSLASN
jgi:hypothetical protein